MGHMMRFILHKDNREICRSISSTTIRIWVHLGRVYKV